MLSGGRKQVRSIQEIRSRARLDLIRELPRILSNPNSREDTQFAILGLFSEIDELDSLAPNWSAESEVLFKITKNVELQKRILELAEKKKEKRLIYAVITGLTHTDYELRQIAYRCVQNMKDDRAMPNVLDLANSPNPIYREYFLESSVWIKDERVQNLINKFSSDESPALRRKFISILQKNNLQDTRGLIPKMAASDEDEDVRLQALEILKDRKNRQYISLFYKGITEQNHDLRAVCVEALFPFIDKSGAKAVSEQLSRETVNSLKIRLIDLLLELGNHGGGQGLITVLENDKEPFLRSKAAEAVGKLGFNPGSTDLKRILDKEKNIDVKLSILRAVGDLKEKTTVPALITFASNKKEKLALRLQAVDTIRIIGDPECLPGLFDAYVFEKTPEVKQELERATRELLLIKTAR
ncbi:HEAT repeat protein [Leptospira broomii serovar Hurstbridge str. 5399]|uniref:HEAT repeat protein n=1 Tax=Leptospira broomii serovar Hurstbridge str. 5399 TaxID=1049789 RepID=T0GG31_9LEPT|nr:HEAT repeat domain-containing protein [Leptospira broomii]EQA45799.1 HEAT repeat protein [Leptospira broomii serovar Hurstbridge str. 5399]